MSSLIGIDDGKMSLVCSLWCAFVADMSSAYFDPGIGVNCIGALWLNFCHMCCGLMDPYAVGRWCLVCFVFRLGRVFCLVMSCNFGFVVVVVLCFCFGMSLGVLEAYFSNSNYSLFGSFGNGGSELTRRNLLRNDPDRKKSILEINDRKVW